MAQSIKDDLEIPRNVRMKDVEEASSASFGIIRGLEEKVRFIILKGRKKDDIMPSIWKLSLRRLKAEPISSPRRRSLSWQGGGSLPDGLLSPLPGRWRGAAPAWTSGIGEEALGSSSGAGILSRNWTR